MINVNFMEDDNILNGDYNNDVSSNEDLTTTEDTSYTTIETNEDLNSKSGLELFLESRGIQDQIIFEDGTTVNLDKLNELDSETLFNVLDSLSVIDNEEQEEEFNEEDVLSSEEENIIKYIRESGKSLSELIKEQALELVDEYGGSFSAASLPDDELFIEDLKHKFPELNDEELLEELELAKQSKNYNKEMSLLRQALIEEEKRQEELKEEELLAQQAQELEAQKEQLIDAAINTDHILGFNLDHDTKNDLLETLVELEDNGNSNFVNTLSDPNNMIRAAWFLKYGDLIFESINDYYNKTLKEEYQRGRKEALEGFPTKPIKTSQETKTKKQQPKNNVTTVYDLYE